MTPRASGMAGAEFGVRDGQYYLTEQRAQAILDLRLQKLTGTGMKTARRIQSCWSRLRTAAHSGRRRSPDGDREEMG